MGFGRAGDTPSWIGLPCPHQVYPRLTYISRDTWQNELHLYKDADAHEDPAVRQKLQENRADIQVCCGHDALFGFHSKAGTGVTVSKEIGLHWRDLRSIRVC